MKLLRVDSDVFLFHLGKREKRLLLELLKHYPLTPTSHHRVSRNRTDPATQRLLQEALSTHRETYRRRLDMLLAQTDRFQADASGYRTQFNREELEWLLQVLNDIRVGSWLALGSPDPDDGKPAQLTAHNTRYLLTMELAGHFECDLLAALDGPAG
ncbi:MAG: hypothetical protein FJ387_12335 [Verrucomicrobia bacterium]|nr:hypothetical protein [Verrucomicrobiota bacterium]